MKLRSFPASQDQSYLLVLKDDNSFISHEDKLNETIIGIDSECDKVQRYDFKENIKHLSNTNQLFSQMQKVDNSRDNSEKNESNLESKILVNNKNIQNFIPIISNIREIQR